MNQVKDVCVDVDFTIRQAMACIDQGGKGIALLVDEEGRLSATFTDGDIRRAILAGISLDASVSELAAHKQQFGVREPATAQAGSTRKELIKIMQKAKISQLPLLDGEPEAAP